MQFWGEKDMQTLVTEKELYTQFAKLLEFPREDIRQIVEECIQELYGSQYPEEVIKELLSFKNDLDKLSLGSLQELYSYTFELVSDTTLDMGYYIHEGFKRARNLLTIKSMYRERG